MPTYNDFNSAGLAFFQTNTPGSTNAGIATSTSAVVSSVSVSTAPSVLQASNAGRKGLLAYSCAGSASPAVVAYTTSVSSTNFSFVLSPGSLWEMPVPLSNIGMSVAVSTALTGGTATVLVTELS